MANLSLNYEGFDKNLVEFYRNDIEGVPGIQYLFSFDNGLGASVIKHRCSYGYEDDLWELAVIKMTGTNPFGCEFEIVCGTPITDDVRGYLTDEDVRDLLRKIKEL